LAELRQPWAELRYSLTKLRDSHKGLSTKRSLREGKGPHEANSCERTVWMTQRTDLWSSIHVLILNEVERVLRSRSRSTWCWLLLAWQLLLLILSTLLILSKLRILAKLLILNKL